jgi:lactate 2-monooxygenase
MFFNLSGSTPEAAPLNASIAWQSALTGKAHTWDDIAFLKQHWDGPIVLKGIQHASDALKAVEVGVDGIVVSNHGGRQADGAVGSADVLPEIVDAVGGRIKVLFDSGIRCGADMAKALALGADAVLVGRPMVYGLAHSGKEGVRHVMKSILADFDQLMAVLGITNIDGLREKGVIRKI